MTLTKIEKVLKVLAKGKNVSVEDIEDKTGVANVSAIIHQLRNEGYSIYTNRKTDPYGGTKYTAYRMSAT